MKALLYIRVSSKEQERDGYSLDAQEKLAIEYAKRMNLNIVRTWKVSESAWKQERRAFNQMVDYAKKHPEVEHIVFDVPDRMTRNDSDKVKIAELVKGYGKSVHFSRTRKVFSRDSSPDDEFLLDIEVAAAKKLSSDISRKTKMGLVEKAEQGFYPGCAPIDYKNNPSAGTIDIDEEKAPFIQLAFRLAASGGKSLEMIADTLYREGFRTKRSNRIPKSTLDRILSNPVYYGAFIWSGKVYRGAHTPIISKELFDKVALMMKAGHRPCYNKKNFVFNNLIRCGVCGCKVLGEGRKNKYIYYHCTFSKGRHEYRSYIREEKLATLFEEPVRRIGLPADIRDWMKKLLAESAKDIVQSREARLRLLNRQYDLINNRLSRLYDARFDDEISKEMFKCKEREYRGQLVDISSQMDDLKSVNPNFYEDGVKILELSNCLYDQYVRAELEDKVRILRSVASNFSLVGTTLYPTYRKPFDILAKGLETKQWGG